MFRAEQLDRVYQALLQICYRFVFVLGHYFLLVTARLGGRSKGRCVGRGSSSVCLLSRA
jgi:hypothetical protein